MLHRSPAFEAMLFKVPGLPGRERPALESHHTSIQEAAACQALGWVPEDRDETRRQRRTQSVSSKNPEERNIPVQLNTTVGPSAGRLWKQELLCIWETALWRMIRGLSGERGSWEGNLDQGTE